MSDKKTLGKVNDELELEARCAGGVCVMVSEAAPDCHGCGGHFCAGIASADPVSNNDAWKMRDMLDEYLREHRAETEGYRQEMDEATAIWLMGDLAYLMGHLKHSARTMYRANGERPSWISEELVDIGTVMGRLALKIHGDYVEEVGDDEQQ